MNSALTFDVVIIGAGPTGLTLANILGQRGLHVALLEQNASTVRAPRAVSIDDESLRTMQAIGLAEEVLRNVAADYGSHYYTTSGRLFAKVEPTTREYGFPRRNAFTQPELEATLLAGVRRFPNVTLSFEHVAESLEESAGQVTLQVRPSGAGAAARTMAATYVVACDGARSATRKIIGASMVGASYPQRWLIVDLASTRERLRQTRVVCNPARPLITLPGPRGIRRYEFMLHDDEDDAAATRPEFLERLLRESGPDAGMPIVRAQPYTFHALIADHWNSARIFLAGDAAHLSPPFAGQGLNSGLRDVFNLGWKLAAVVQGSFDARLLDTYFTEREPHARELIQLAVQMGRVFMWPDLCRPVVDHFELGGDLDPVAIRIHDEDKKIVARTMASRTPHELDALRGKVVGPVADRVPLAGLIGMVIDTLAILEEAGQVVVFMVAAHEDGHQLAFFIHHPVRDAEAELARVEGLDRLRCT